MKIPLLDIARRLPHYSVAEARQSQAVSIPHEVSPAYVWPEISYASDDVNGQVMLISAPGAMGKTMAAEALAAEANIPRLDLSQIRVGNGTLAGELGKFMGMGPAGMFIDSLTAGRAAVVIDGLDEAQLKSGTENFFAFLEDLAELIRGATLDCQIILLGRPDSISGASAVLAENQISVVEVALEPLDLRSVEHLIAGSLDRMKDQTAHRKFESPFSELLRHVFRDLGGALVGRDGDLEELWDGASTFLGYPPVVLAISRRLAVSNPKQELEKLRQQGATSTMTRGRLLRQICEDILDREQEKVQRGVADALGFGADDSRISILYGREEQLVRILRRVAEADMMVVPPESLTPTEKARYEDLISNFIVDHPFLLDRKFSSIVFSDYLRSFISTSDTIAAFGPSRADLIRFCPEVGPFLFHFIHALRAVEGQDVVASVGEDAVDSLLRSFQVEDNPGRFAVFVQTDGVAHLMLAYGSDHFNPLGGEPLGSMSAAVIFQVEELSGAVEITTPISHVNVITDVGMVVKSRSGVCEIGPSVILFAAEIEFSGDRLFVIPPQSTEYGVTIGFDSATHDPSMRISSPRADALAVFADARVHPWSKYVSELPRRASISSEKMRAGVFQVRRILTAFGRSKGESPARNKELVDRVIVGTSESAREVLDGMIRLGYIVEDGSLYRLDLEELAKVDVSYGSLDGSQFATALAPIVEQIFGEG